jgi:hypothetical protein
MRIKGVASVLDATSLTPIKSSKFLARGCCQCHVRQCSTSLNKHDFDGCTLKTLVGFESLFAATLLSLFAVVCASLLCARFQFIDHHSSHGIYHIPASPTTLILEITAER